MTVVLYWMGSGIYPSFIHRVKKKKTMQPTNSYIDQNTNGKIPSLRSIAYRQNLSGRKGLSGIVETIGPFLSCYFLKKLAQPYVYFRSN